MKLRTFLFNQKFIFSSARYRQTTIVQEKMVVNRAELMMVVIWWWIIFHLITDWGHIVGEIEIIVMDHDNIPEATTKIEMIGAQLRESKSMVA